MERARQYRDFTRTFEQAEEERASERARQISGKFTVLVNLCCEFSHYTLTFSERSRERDATERAMAYLKLQVAFYKDKALALSRDIVRGTRSPDELERERGRQTQQQQKERDRESLLSLSLSPFPRQTARLKNEEEDRAGGQQNCKGSLVLSGGGGSSRPNKQVQRLQREQERASEREKERSCALRCTLQHARKSQHV